MSCNKDNAQDSNELICCCDAPKLATIYLVPMDGMKDEEVQKLQETLEEKLISLQKEKMAVPDWPYEYQIKVLNHEKSPDTCLNNIKSRYRATKLIGFLKEKHAEKLDVGSYIIGITNKDLSTSIHDKDDYGILGLSYKPGNTSIISTFRLKNKKDLWKLALHEYCHGFFSMGHCPNKDRKCIMKDAEGGNPHFELKEILCKTCLAEFSK